MKSAALFRRFYDDVRMTRGLLILGGIARKSEYFAPSPITHDSILIKIMTVGEDLKHNLGCETQWNPVVSHTRKYLSCQSRGRGRACWKIRTESDQPTSYPLTHHVRLRLFCSLVIVIRKQFAGLGYKTDVKLFQAFLISGTTDEVDVFRLVYREVSCLNLDLITGYPT
jgi:hypothetical protein